MAGYNGWANYETWLVRLWMDNEKGTYDYWLEATERHVKGSKDKDEAIRDLTSEVKQYHEEALPTLEGFAADLLGAAMSAVDWRQIATSLVDDYIAENPEEVEAKDSAS